MTDGWTTVTIGDVAIIFDGPHATPTKTDVGPWYLSISSLVNGRLDLSASVHLSEEDYPRWSKRVRPQPGDTLFSYETRLGDAAYWNLEERAAVGRRMGVLRPKAGVDARFLTYAYLGPQFQDEIQRRAIRGATVDRIPIAELGTWPILMPPLAEQRRIAGVLGALDDLIEINQRLARSCDEQAEALWLRAIEDGFVNIRVADVAHVVLGGTPSRARPDFWSGQVPWLNSGKANEFRICSPSEQITALGLQSSSTKMMPSGTTVVAITGATLGQVSRTEIDACGNQSLVGVYSSERPINDSLYFGIRSRIDVLLRSATGGAQQHVNKANVGELEVPMPRKSTLHSWHTVAEPLMQSTAKLLFESADLARTRDELLPLLLSGRVSVREVAA